MGSCIFCGKFFKNGHPNKLPENFMSHQFLQAGNGICSRCYAFLKSSEARRNSWIIRGPEMRVELIETLENPLGTLLNPPDTPFRLYLTRKKRKHGWIRLLLNPAMSRSLFWVAYEEDLILVDTEKANKFHGLVERLREKGVKKSSLKLGIPIGEIRRRGITFQEVTKVRQKIGNPLWEVVVSFAA